MPASEYGRKGLAHQQLTLPGTDKINPPPRLRKWEDMTPEHRASVSADLQNTYGITMRNAIHNHGALIDRAVTTTGERGRNFYRGGADWDSASSVGRDSVSKLAKKHGLTFSKAAYLRAALSPRSNVHDETQNAEKLAAWHNEGAQGTPPKVSGLSGASNTRRALSVLRHEGAPEKASRESGESEFGTPSTEKISSYAQSYTHPDHPDTRTAVDTHAVGGMAPHLPKSAPMRPTGKVDAKGRPYLTAVSKGHPDWVPNQEDALNKRGTYEFFDYAQRKAAQKRGLSATEGQSLAWHAERASKPQQPGSGRGKTLGGKKVKISPPHPETGTHMNPGQFEDSGQQRLF